MGLERVPSVASQTAATIPPETGVVGEAVDPFNFITLGWLSKMIFIGAKRPLQFSDLPLIPETSKSDFVAKVISPFYDKLDFYLKNSAAHDGGGGNSNNKSKAKTTVAAGVKKPSYFLLIWRHVAVSWIFSVLMDMAATFLETTQPTVMAAILNYLTIGSSQFFITNPTALAISFFLMSFLGLIFQQAVMQMFRKMRYTVRSILMTAIYAKSLKLSNASATKFPKGRILQMVNVDIPMVSEMVEQAHKVLLVPFQLAFSFYYLSTLFGAGLWPVGAVFGGFAVTMPVAFGLVISGQQKYMKQGDKRLSFFREILEGMKMIKLRGQESYFKKVLAGIRLGQEKAIFQMYVGFAVRNNTFVNPAVIFPAVTYFFNIFQPMQALPNVFGGLANAAISWNRIRSYLLAEESEFKSRNSQDSENGKAIEITDASFRWEDVKKEDDDDNKKDKNKTVTEKKEEPAKKFKRRAAKPVKNQGNEGDGSLELSNIGKEAQQDLDPTIPLFQNLNLSIPTGKLTAIVGTVGSGKSSLISAITGEMTRLAGNVVVYGSVALCQQQSWLMSMSVRDNILFGRELDDELLDEVVRVCGLEVDIAQFQYGLATEIGEKGIALSGGQKARIALARALYSDSDIYLLDDPLAALDSHVGKHVFEKCIKERLDGKTRVLVTHQLHVLPHVDQIVVFAKGVVVEQGSFDDLVTNGPENGVLKEMLKNHSLAKEQEEKEGTKDNERTKSTGTHSGKSKREEKNNERGTPPTSTEKDGLIQEEDRQVGAVGKKYILNYIKLSGGFFMFTLLFLSAVGYSIASFGQNLWISFWSNDSEAGTVRWGLSAAGYTNVYAGVICATFFFAGGMQVTTQLTTYRAAKAYHNNAIKGLFQAPMSFYDSQPLGRIINRLTKDMETLDLQIWNNVLNFFLVLALAISQLVGVVYATLYTLIFIAILAVLYYYLLNMYRANQREIRRLAAIQKSPLNAYISECIGGTSTIRAFQAANRTIHHQRHLMDLSVMPDWTLENVYNWFSIRLQVFLTSLTLFFVLFAVLTKLNASIAGLALSGVSSIGGMFFTSITTFSRLESDFVAAERLDLYANDLPAEAPAHLPNDPSESEWPRYGKISIKDLQVKYASKSEPVIKKLSIDINGSEKIGVVGRTGSGKSTLMTALFRIVEPSKGSVWIDGVDVSRIGLHTLRSRLQIIPQEPVMFTGTVRTNLDVESKFSDQELWNALDLVGLKDYVSELPEKLDAPVAERGENFSVGQRQLMMLACAICHKPKILVMDEASSSVDQAADLLIQSSIRTHFRETTVISIAHRVNTIADFDRIMVLDAGELIEFDSPSNLLHTESSLFKALVDATGPTNAALVVEIADKHSIS
ncbi:hypothetical protein HK100_002851 [Physocladia obscura]|uniref:Uncharacterized protein n=1 Tax=Physocladia obscura TaxID=109957 RepID=A0AAD5SV28_9FUNG|nr:hypothetical protein HK100_002851 [Physocladia obscura]